MTTTTTVEEKKEFPSPSETGVQKKNTNGDWNNLKDPASATSSSSSKKKKDDGNAAANRANGVKTPHDNDVLSGRGNFVNRHRGNEFLRYQVNTFKFDYASSTKAEKPRFAAIIHEKIKALDPPGRFLKKDPGDDLWYEIPEKKSLDKIRQALREGVPDIINEMVSYPNNNSNGNVGGGGGPPAASGPYGAVPPLRHPHHHHHHFAASMSSQQSSVMSGEQWDAFRRNHNMLNSDDVGHMIASRIDSCEEDMLVRALRDESTEQRRRIVEHKPALSDVTVHPVPSPHNSHSATNQIIGGRSQHPRPQQQQLSVSSTASTSSQRLHHQSSTSTTSQYTFAVPWQAKVVLPLRYSTTRQEATAVHHQDVGAVGGGSGDPQQPTSRPPPSVDGVAATANGMVPPPPARLHPSSFAATASNPFSAKTTTAATTENPFSAKTTTNPFFATTTAPLAPTSILRSAAATSKSKPPPPPFMSTKDRRQSEMSDGSLDLEDIAEEDQNERTNSHKPSVFAPKQQQQRGAELSSKKGHNRSFHNSINKSFNKSDMSMRDMSASLNISLLSFNDSAAMQSSYATTGEDSLLTAGAVDYIAEICEESQDNGGNSDDDDEGDAAERRRADASAGNYEGTNRDDFDRSAESLGRSDGNMSFGDSATYSELDLSAGSLDPGSDITAMMENSAIKNEMLQALGCLEDSGISLS